jgi:rare lipoprotein A
MANPRTAIPSSVLTLALACSACVREAETGAEPRSTQPAAGGIEATYEAPPPAPRTEAGDGPQVEQGYATWYGAAFAGRKTASGERFDPGAFTAAHRTLPFGTWVEVKRVDTGETVRVRITDRGPFAAPSARRIIDLSRGAAEKIGLVRAGVAPVEVRVVAGP